MPLPFFNALQRVLPLLLATLINLLGVLSEKGAVWFQSLHRCCYRAGSFGVCRESFSSPTSFPHLSFSTEDSSSREVSLLCRKFPKQMLSVKSLVCTLHRCFLFEHPCSFLSISCTLVHARLYELRFVRSSWPSWSSSIWHCKRNSWSVQDIVFLSLS